jgi:glycosyltransferase involved in cell wall biosynthesis
MSTSNPTGNAAHVSAVICTRNRPDKIGQAVASVLANDYPNFELTVIDQSTTDATEVAIHDLLDADPRLHYIHSDEPGLSRAYNNGIGRTTGEIIAFTDDDCIVPTDWIANIAAAFESEPDGELLYGQVVPAFDQGDEFGLTPSLPITQPTRLSRKDGFRVFGMGANFAARRRLFDRVGVFDEILGGGGPLKSSQDYDLAYRTYRAESVILLRPEVTLRHDGRREAEDWPALLTAYGIGDGAFYTKHVRCRDPYALWLLTKKLGDAAGRWVVRAVLRRRPNRAEYGRGIVVGIRDSFKFGVDRQTRLYREKSKGDR